jgi:hypothetical protein
VAEKTCPTCGDQNVHANIPSEIIACATRTSAHTPSGPHHWVCKALVNALHAYAEEIDERSHPKQRFTDLFASMARRLDDDPFVTVPVSCGN